jgi:hypothetical protein
MWHKIINENDIKAGMALNQYPVEGNPVDTIDLSDSYNLLTFKVDTIEQVDGAGDIVHLSASTAGGSTINRKINDRITSTSGTIAIDKQRKEFVEDDCWWVFTPGQ